MKCHLVLMIAAAMVGGVICEPTAHSAPAPRMGGLAKEVVPSDPFAGRWEGVWKSTKRSGEGGRLRCTFTRIDRSHYTAAFRANWSIFSSGYTAIFDVQRRGGAVAFRGTHRLPAIFGGLYQFQGTVTHARFWATYSSSYDRGIFEMYRPQR